MSWARAIVFAVGFFFISAILIGQLPGFIYNFATSSSMATIEVASLALGLLGLAGFTIIVVIEMLFDPKPVVPPAMFTVVGLISSVLGLAIILGASYGGLQYFPGDQTSILPLLGGKFLWFQPADIDLVMVGTVIFGVGLALVFYSLLAMREMRNPDRRDLGTTPLIRLMLVLGMLLLGGFMIFYMLFDPAGLKIPGLNVILNMVLGSAVFLGLGAFALRLHYLMRPVRQRTMPVLYMVGINLAQIGAIFVLFWLLLYPALAWIHSWTFIGLGDYLTVCAKKSSIPSSCAFSGQAGYIIDTIVTMGFFTLLMAGIWAWKTKRNAVIITGVTTSALLGLAFLLTHMNSSQIYLALLLCGGILVMATIWTSVARREFAVVGENNLGCVGQWLIAGTCLFTYLAAFAFFSLPVFPPETETNVSFQPGLLVPAPANPPVKGLADAVVMFFLMVIIAGIHFYYLTRNRYKI